MVSSIESTFRNRSEEQRAQEDSAFPSSSVTSGEHDKRGPKFIAAEAKVHADIEQTPRGSHGP